MCVVTDPASSIEDARAPSFSLKLAVLSLSSVARYDVLPEGSLRNYIAPLEGSNTLRSVCGAVTEVCPSRNVIRWDRGSSCVTEA